MESITTYISSLDEKKRADMQALHEFMLQHMPGAKLWFLDGKDEMGRVVTNPNIGYGEHTIVYKDGSTKDFYRIGISANTSGISIYVMDTPDKNYLKENFGISLGKVQITGYCIKFKKLADLDLGSFARLLVCS